MDDVNRKARVSTFSHVLIVAKYNFVNYFRARRFYVMLAIVLLISGLMTFVIAYRRPPSILSDPLSFYSTAWGRFLSIVILMTAAIFGGDAISGEFQNRTGYFLVPNPVRRSAVYVGKWLAAAAASSLALGAFALLIMLNGLYYFGLNLPSPFLQSLVFAWVYLAAALALQFLFSSLFKTSAISILVFVILMLFVFGVVELLSGTFLGIEPWFALSYGGAILTSVLEPVYPPHMLVTPVPGGNGQTLFTITTYYASVPEGLLIMAAYFVISAAIGLWLFEKKEFST